MVRAKFIVSAKGNRMQSVWNGAAMVEQEVYDITLFPVTGGAPGSENAAFFASTPTGRIDLQTVNQAAADQFVQGNAYYVDFTEA